MRDGAVVKLAPKVFETLLALVEGRGRVLDKAALMKRVWPNSFVEEGNLTLNISTLRKALGETFDQHRYVVTVPGEGYRFVADVTPVNDDALEHEAPPAEDLAQAVLAERVASAAKGVPVATATPIGRPRSFSIAPFGLVLVIAIAAGGFWLYQSSFRDADEPVASAASPTQPMTVTRFATHGGVPFRVAISPRRQGRWCTSSVSTAVIRSGWVRRTPIPACPISQRTDLTYGEPVVCARRQQPLFHCQRRYPSPADPGANAGAGRRDDRADAERPQPGDVLARRHAARLRSSRRDGTTDLSRARQRSDGSHLRTLISRTWPEAVSTEGLAWSPDGSTIAAGTKTRDGQEEISAVSVADGSVRALGAHAWGVTGNLAWLPDGTGLVLLARENSVARKAHIWLVPYPTGDARKITNDLNLYLTTPSACRPTAHSPSCTDSSIRPSGWRRKRTPSGRAAFFKASRRDTKALTG